MPEPRAQGPRRRGLGRQASSQARQVAQDLARMDVALGPAEVALGNIIGILAGAVVGMIPAIVFRSGGLLPIGVLLGAIGGWLAFRLIRGRTIRGWRLGGCGVLLVGLLTICGACAAIGAISSSRDTRTAMQSWRNAREMGLPVPKGVAEKLDAPSLGERVETFFLDRFAFIQESRWIALVGTLVGVVMVVVGGFALVFLIVGRIKGWI